MRSKKRTLNPIRSLLGPPPRSTIRPERSNAIINVILMKENMNSAGPYFELG